MADPIPTLSELMAGMPTGDEKDAAIIAMAKLIRGEPENDQEPKLLVSDDPGAYEAHLIRRAREAAHHTRGT